LSRNPGVCASGGSRSFGFAAAFLIAKRFVSRAFASVTFAVAPFRRRGRFVVDKSLAPSGSNALRGS
jgi:hypothetical protein